MATNGSDRPSDAKRKVLWLCLVFLEYFEVTRDPRFVNIVLKLLDERWLAMSRHDLEADVGRDENLILYLLVRCLTETALVRISDQSWKTERNLPAPDTLEPEPKLPMARIFPPGESPGVVVFCPNPYSLYTLTVLELLRLHGVNVQAIAVRQLLSLRRFIQEYRRDGTRLLRKIRDKLLLGRRAYRARPYMTMPQYMNQIGATDKSVWKWARRNHIPIWRCITLNDDHVLSQLSAHRPAAVIFTGGGLIREPVLNATGRGIVNCHIGLLPAYRGMDVVEWPILEGHAAETGLTVHLMSAGLDEGDILARFAAPGCHTSSIPELRERMEVLMPQAIVDVTLRWLQGRLAPSPQLKWDGRQFFVMHRRLQEIAESKYRGHVGVAATPCEVS